MRTALTLWSTIGILNAQLEFSDKVQQVELDPSQEQVKLSYPFLATGDTTLSELKVACSCMTAQTGDQKSSWTTGEQGVVEITIDTSLMHGTATKSLSLITQDHPEQKLSAEITIPIAITATPRNYKWKLGSKPDPKTFRINIAPGFDFDFTEIKPSNPNFDFELKPVDDAEQEGRNYEFTVTPTQMVESAFCLFKFETDSEIPRYQSFSLIATVQ